MLTDLPYLGLTPVTIELSLTFFTSKTRRGEGLRRSSCADSCGRRCVGPGAMPYLDIACSKQPNPPSAHCWVHKWTGLHRHLSPAFAGQLCGLREPFKNGSGLQDKQISLFACGSFEILSPLGGVRHSHMYLWRSIHGDCDLQHTHEWSLSLYTWPTNEPGLQRVAGRAPST